MTAADGSRAEPERCELCGVPVVDGTQVYGLLGEPMALGAVQPLARQRLLTACTAEHLDELLRRGSPEG